MLDQSVPKALTQPQAAAAPTAPSCSPCSPRLPQAPAPEGCPDTGLVASPGLVLQEHREPEHSRTPRVLSGGDRRGCKGRVLVVPRGRRGSPPRSQPWGGRDPGGLFPRGPGARRRQCPAHTTALAVPQHHSHTALGAVVTGQQHPHTGGVKAPGTALRINPHASSIVVKHLFIKVI